MCAWFFFPRQFFRVGAGHGLWWWPYNILTELLQAAEKGRPSIGFFFSTSSGYTPLSLLSAADNKAEIAKRGASKKTEWLCCMLSLVWDLLLTKEDVCQAIADSREVRHQSKRHSHGLQLDAICNKVPQGMGFGLVATHNSDLLLIFVWSAVDSNFKKQQNYVIV